MDISLQSTVVQLQKYSSHNRPPLSKDVEDMAQSYITQLNANHAVTDMRKRKYQEARLTNQQLLQKEQDLSAIYDKVQKQEQHLYLEKTKMEDQLRELKTLLKEKRKEKQGRNLKIEDVRTRYKDVFGLEMIEEENGYYRIIFTKFPDSSTVQRAYFRFRIEDKILYAVEINPSIPQLPSLTSDLFDMIKGMSLNPLLEQIRCILKQDPQRLTEIVKRLHKGWSQL